MHPPILRAFKVDCRTSVGILKITYRDAARSLVKSPAKRPNAKPQNLLPPSYVYSTSRCFRRGIGILMARAFRASSSASSATFP